MLDPKKIAELDQARSIVAEVLPPMLKSFYDGLLKEGFTEERAFALTGIYLAQSIPRPDPPKEGE